MIKPEKEKKLHLHIIYYYYHFFCSSARPHLLMANRMHYSLSLVVFIGVLQYAKAGSGPPPSSASCTTTCDAVGNDYTYSESISNGQRTISFTQCPNHLWTAINPNDACSGSETLTVPSEPQYDSSAQTDLSAQGGTVGILYNGAALYSPFAGSVTLTNYQTSAAYLEGDSFDECSCHSAPTSNGRTNYHCHVPPSCLLKQLGQTSTDHSPQVGWAADGFPVYGPRGPNGTMMQACTVNGNTSPCTDECGGYYDNSGSIDKFVYR